MANDAEQSPERRVVHYSGRVQGVGFRFTARGYAERFRVPGFVENLADGRVRMVVEDVPTKLDQLLQAIAEEMDRFIRNTDVEVLPSRGEFHDFQIRR